MKTIYYNKELYKCEKMKVNCGYHPTIQLTAILILLSNYTYNIYLKAEVDYFIFSVNVKHREIKQQ